jgi:Fe-S-cluster-containing dehydrogenase component
MEQRRPHGAVDDYEAWGDSPRRLVQPHPHLRSGRGRGPHGAFPKSCLHCETPACVTVVPDRRLVQARGDGIVLVNEDKCIGCKLCSWACPMARANSTGRGVMKKCTLCIDRIYNETLDERDRVPACVAACPVGARHFGDLGDETSPVSQLVAERGGYG